MEVLVTRTITAGVVAVVLALTSCGCVQNSQDDSAMTAMVAHGSSPVAARCAVKGGGGSESYCAIIAAGALR
jgi:hypothetical protein